MANEKLVRYWIETAEDNFASMERIFAAGEYTWALFIGHLVIEKLLKACCAKKLGKDVPKIHNLFRLAALAELDVSEKQKETFARLMVYHTKARYAEWGTQFRKVITREVAAQDLAAVKEIRQWLLDQLSKR